MKYLFTILILNVFVLFAQNESAVEFFKADEFNKKVLLTWTLTEGNTCNGIDVFRSIDGINYTKIGDIEGVCGSAFEAVDYNFTDLFPEKNAVNHYRLGLGGLGYSYIINTEIIDVPANSYQIRPQPINSNGLLLFNNDSSKEANLMVFNTKGELVLRETTLQSRFNLGELTTHPPGMYYFKLSINETELVGKIIVP